MTEAFVKHIETITHAEAAWVWVPDLITEVRRLKAALEKYGRHAETCGRAHYEGCVPCRCGLDAALEEGDNG